MTATATRRISTSRACKIPRLSPAMSTSSSTLTSSTAEKTASTSSISASTSASQGAKRSASTPTTPPAVASQPPTLSTRPRSPMENTTSPWSSSSVMKTPAATTLYATISPSKSTTRRAPRSRAASSPATAVSHACSDCVPFPFSCELLRIHSTPRPLQPHARSRPTGDRPPCPPPSCARILPLSRTTDSSSSSSSVMRRLQDPFQDCPHFRPPPLS
mmetsp:Transcript_6203/g.16175  ORF Transcript_6203/g.16175 Transcript_6203/m.16175 type:complete len:217 (-) Transcript_6203:220-870(-)